MGAAKVQGPASDFLVNYIQGYSLRVNTITCVSPLTMVHSLALISFDVSESR